MTDASKGLRLYNTLTRTKEDFVPIDAQNVRMYVCGPTVYDFAHIGNARPAIVFDVLFRLLRHLYGGEHVTYVRNITDVDDKINARALRDFGDDIASAKLSLNEAIRRVTEKTADQYQGDVTALGCLPPTFQPRATEFVEPRADGKADMIGLIRNLIDRGHAYEAAGEVLFDIASMADYGQLSKRPLDEQQAGARIAVDAHKKNPGDFVLWKLSSPEEPGWQSPWGRGRPGWHIECSAMSAAYLGEVFDIHGGGLDLIFPHHENEIAQSRCAHGTDVMANYWMHNGFLQVEGQKMSKSLGNFYSINELLETENFGGRKWDGPVLRLAMLMTHYREPIDFSVRRLEEAAAKIANWRSKINDWNIGAFLQPPDAKVLASINDDLDTSSVFARLSELERSLEQVQTQGPFAGSLALLGIAPFLEIQNWIDYEQRREDEAFGAIWDRSPPVLVNRPTVANFLLSNRHSFGRAKILSAIGDRKVAITAKNWVEADRIRDELLAQGIQLKDGKDPATGERITTWEVKR